MEKFFIIEILKDGDIKACDGSDIDMPEAILYDSYEEAERNLDEVIKYFHLYKDKDEKIDFRITKVEI